MRARNAWRATRGFAKWRAVAGGSVFPSDEQPVDQQPLTAALDPRDDMSMSAQSKLVGELERARQFHHQRRNSRALAAALDRLADWQARRLDATYADLVRNPRYAAATAFFRSELYGPGDYSRRDADLARVVPLMVRVVPSGVIETMAMAIELSALSQELDRTLLGFLDASAPFTVTQYCAAYRACANRSARSRQIALIGRTGRSLDRYVRAPLVRATLGLMRRPARAAGLSALQTFLDRGFAAFAAMRGADEFLTTVETRETTLMDAIFAGASSPFADPLG